MNCHTESTLDDLSVECNKALDSFYGTCGKSQVFCSCSCFDFVKFMLFVSVLLLAYWRVQVTTLLRAA